MDSDSDIDIKVGRMSYYHQSSVLTFYLFGGNASDLYFECMLAGTHMNVLFHFRVKHTFS